MKNKFIDAYLNIITEAWDRFDYYDIIKAVKNITNECKDPWVKGESGSKVLALLKESGSHKRGNERIRHSTLLDENDYEIIANNDTYITMYWRARSKSGSDFDSSAFRSIWTYCSANDYRKSDVLAQEVGKIAYAVWKALNSRHNKIEKNLKEFAEIEKDYGYQERKQVKNLDLIVKDVDTAVNYYRGIGAHFAEPLKLICEDSAKSGIKYIIKLGTNTSKALADLFSRIKRDGKLEEFLSFQASKLEETFHKEFSSQFSTLEEFLKEFKSKLLGNINISGKISKISKENKSVTMNYVTINSPTDSEVKSMEDQYLEMKKKEEEDAKITSKISEYIEFIRTCVNTGKKDPTLKDNEGLVNMIKQNVDYLKSDEIYESLNDDQKKIVKETEEFFIS